MLLSLIYGSTGFGQAFQTTIANPNFDYNHYSIETLPSAGGGYICAGTLFGAGNNDIHVFKVNTMGNMVWERIIDLSPDDRALDVVIDPYGAIVITGYTSPQIVPNDAELYIAKLGPSGNVLADSKLAGFQASVGTNVIYSSLTNTYVVGGFYGEPLTGYPLIGNEALVAEFDISTLGLNGHVEIMGGIDQHSAINDIVETSNGYFVTGSVGLPGSEEQGVLAVTLNTSLAITGDVSFESTNHQHVGVSLVYYAADDIIYLMSNNSIIHNPQVTAIVDVANAPVIADHYALVLDPSLGTKNAAGFELKLAPWNANRLVACGYFKEYPDMFGVNHTTPWITEFDRVTGAMVNCFVWPTSAQNFHATGGGVLSTFEGEHPYIYNQEILTERLDGQGFVFVGPRRVGARFGIDLVTTHWGGGMPCYNNYMYSTDVIYSAPLTVFDNYYTITNPSPGAVTGPGFSIHTVECPAMAVSPTSPPTDETENGENDALYGTTAGLLNDAANSDLLEVSPNPFNDNVWISLKGDNLSGEITIRNAIGQIVYQSNEISGEGFSTTVDASSFDKGIYVISYSNSNGVLKTKKIVKI